MHPYISDPIKSEEDSKYPHEEQANSYKQSNNPSSATLVPPIKAGAESTREISASSMSSPQKSYYWPMSHDSAFSAATKSVFEKRDAGSKENAAKKATDNEAPVPRFFTDRENFLTQHANLAHNLESIRGPPEHNQSCPATNFTICCNNCEEAIPDAHWHCGICDTGDFDLCQDCVDDGNLCENEDHWLIKRFVKDGKVIPSTTETIGPKKPTKVEHEEKVPGAFTPELKREATRERLDLSRTCNSCVGGKVI